MNEDSTNSMFQIPTDMTPVAAPAENIVAEAAKVTPVQESIELKHTFSNTTKLDDATLFDELNAISDEVIRCRDHVLSNIS